MAILRAVENLAYKTDKNHHETLNFPIQSSSNHSHNQPTIQKSSCIRGYSLLCLKFSALLLRFSPNRCFAKTNVSFERVAELFLTNFDKIKSRGTTA